MKKPLMGQRALVTGASSGIGEAIARDLAGRGVEVVLTARRKDRLQEVVKQIRAQGGRASLDAGDLLDRAFRQHLRSRYLRGVETCSILVNNAAFGMNGRFLESDPDRMQQLVELGLEIPMELSAAFGEAAAERGFGGILATASVAAFVPTPFHALYSATKAGLKNYHLALREELVHRGVTVTTVCPGLTDTEFFESGKYSTKSLVYKVNRMAPARVAKDAVDALVKGRDIVIPGRGNRFMLWLSTHLPRGFVVRTAGKTMNTDS